MNFFFIKLISFKLYYVSKFKYLFFALQPLLFFPLHHHIRTFLNFSPPVAQDNKTSSYQKGIFMQF